MLHNPQRIAIIGAGAAGCFCAVQIRRRFPDAQITIYEASRIPMNKLSRTGGGRCNLTNSFRAVSNLQEVYPRGHRLMKRALSQFSPAHTAEWWRSVGVALMVQSDERVFPVSEDAMQVVRTLERLLRQSDIPILCDKRAERVIANSGSTLSSPEDQFAYTVQFADGSTAVADKLVVAIGGSSTHRLANMLPDGIELAQSVPSLFTFKIAHQPLTALMGLSVPCVALGLAGTKIKSNGALLITDWGLSGPAVLRLSSYGARELAQKAYNAQLIVCWTGTCEQQIRQWMEQYSGSPKQLSSLRPEGIPERLWRYILERAGLRCEQKWAELGRKGANRLVATLSADEYSIVGRAAFKEEFVTCGGVELTQVKSSNLESVRYPGLFFAGEVLDIDALTGGFNLQAAWSTAQLVAEGI